MAQLTYEQIQQVWTQNGGDPRWAPLMAGIAIAESGGITDALNPDASTGDYSAGLWQINYRNGINAPLVPGQYRAGMPIYGGGPGVSPQQAAANLMADPNLQAKAAIDLLGQNAAGIGNWTNDATWQKWMAAGAPQAPSSDTVKAWLGGSSTGINSEISGLNASGNAVVQVNVGCGSGDLGGVDIFGAHIGTKCQLKGFTGGLMVGMGLIIMGAGLFILARNTGAAQAVLKAAPGGVGKAARMLPKQIAPSTAARQAAPKAPSAASRKRDTQAAKAAESAQDEAVKQAQFAQMDANLRNTRRAA